MSVDFHNSTDSKLVFVAIFYHFLVVIKVNWVCLLEGFCPFLAHWSLLWKSSLSPRSPAGGNLL